MKTTLLIALGASMTLSACATAIQTNAVLAEALPTEKAEDYVLKVSNDYGIDNTFMQDISKCAFEDGQVIVLQPRMIGNKFKEVKRFAYSDSYYEYQTGVPYFKESFFISKKDRVMSGAYSNKWCYLYDARKIPEAERANTAKRTATALEAMGVKTRNAQ